MYLILLGLLPTLCLGQEYAYPGYQGYIDPEKGPFCKIGDFGSPLCCEGRNDSCSMPRGYGAMETRCYCDSFCVRTHPRPADPDCCPDYPQACLNEPEPTPKPIIRCYYKGQYHNAREMFHDNCQVCECVPMGNRMEVMCMSPTSCMIDEDVIDRVNRRERRGWTAGNVTNFWGRELERDGYNGMLGTSYSSKKVRTMRAIKSHVSLNELPRNFDWRQRGIVHPIIDQKFCNSSWSYSIVSTYSDRLAKWSNGEFRGPLSYQQHKACVRGQSWCHAGYLTRSWKYVSRKGLTTESCYPQSTNSRCEIREGRLAQRVTVRCASGGEDKLYKASPLSRLGGEAAIMKEIKDAGPVIATMRVFHEFFMYKGGVYDCPARNPKSGRLHSVKLVGWGEENNGEKYWIAANSWGTDWGEDGFFKIRRGQNDCDIEEFILAFYTNSRRFKRNSGLNDTLDFTNDMVKDIDQQALDGEFDDDDDVEDDDDEEEEE